MKKILKKSIPYLLALIIFFQSVYSSMEIAKGAAIPEVIYYTYWDLISSLCSVCGYDMKIDEPVINNHGVTGKQVWDNFCTFVESTVKVNYAFLSDGAKMALTELKDLANTVTDKGIFISQDLYNLLRDAFAYEATAEGTASFSNQFDCSSAEKVKDMLIRLSGCSSYDGVNNLSSLATAVAGGAILNGIYMASCQRFIFWTGTETLTYEPYRFLLNGESFSAQSYWVNQFNKSVTKSYGIFGVNPDYSWIMQHGAICYPDALTLECVSDYACPEEVPEVVPWRKEVTVPDEWRVIPGGGSDEDPDKDPEKNPDVLPVWLPIKPLKPDKPDSTEDPSTETTEDPDKDDDKDKDKDQDVVVNPTIDPIIQPDPINGVIRYPDGVIDPDVIIEDPGHIIPSKYGDITKLFPFCIPFDIVNMIRGMRADKKPPSFHFEHKFKQINYTFVVDVDLTDYDKYIKIFRYGMQIFYVLALMFLTIKISKLFI